MSYFPTPSDQPGAQQRPFEHPYTLHGAGLRDTRTVDLSPCATIMRAHRDTTPHAHQRRDQPARSRALPPPSRHLAATAPRRSSCAALHTLREESAASESGQSTPRSPLRPERGPQPAARRPPPAARRQVSRACASACVPRARVPPLRAAGCSACCRSCTRRPRRASRR